MKIGNRVKIFSLLIAVSLCMLFALCGYAHGETFFDFSDGQDTGNQSSAWNYPIPLSLLKDELDVLRLINRENLLEKEYPDQHIEMYEMAAVTVSVTYGKMTIRSVVNVALEKMFAAAEAEGIKLYVGSAYRDYRSQEVIHYNRVKKLGKDDGVVQMAGASEHQAGLAADVVSWAYRDGFQTSFADTREGRWLAANCAAFGFIIRYPEGKTEITGIGYEPWHVRYVGAEVAVYIAEAGLTLEEFTAEWQAELEKYERAGY